ncbi:armadillo-type protein [Pholiota molesta]|nr:armadillo-type protein [Pholiota molesta]
MGKSQKKKVMRRHNPMRVPDSHLPKGLASASESSSKSNEILPILQRMENADASERKWACVAVSNLIQNDPSTRRLLQGKNVVGALITRLTDSEEEVSVEAVGALRNLCIDGGFDICAEMYNKNILTPLKSFIPKISTTLSQFLGEPKGAAEAVRRIVYDFADNVITILWCLSETSNKALNAINEIRLVPFLMSFLAARDKLPLSTVTSAAITDVRADGSYLATLLSIARQEQPQSPEVKADPRSTTLAVLAAGTLRNVSPIPPPSSASFIDIDKDVVLPLLQPLIQRQANEPSLENLSLKNTPKSDHKSTIEVELELLEAKLRTVQLALEILTGTCATLPDPEPDVPANQEAGDDEAIGKLTAFSELEFEDEAVIDADMSMDEEPTTTPTNSAPSFLTTLVAPLIALIQPTALSFPPLAAPSIHPPTTALECLNNRLKRYHAGVTVWNGVWSALGLVGTQSGLGQERRQEMWEISTGVLWGIGRVWKGAIVPNGEQVNLLIQLSTASSNPRLQVKCIGALECLAQNPTAIEANQIISNYLISLLPSATNTSPVGTEPMVQAASALIDIYSDETFPYDVNFRQGDYLSKLAASVSSLKTAVKAIDRRKEGGKELRRRGEEVYENLRDFVQYRKDLGL